MCLKSMIGSKHKYRSRDVTYIIFDFVVVMIHFWTWYFHPANTKTVSGFLHVAVLLNCFGFVHECVHTAKQAEGFRCPVCNLATNCVSWCFHVSLFSARQGLSLFIFEFNVLFAYRAWRRWRNNPLPNDSCQSTRESPSSRTDLFMPELKWEVLHFGTWDNTISLFCIPPSHPTPFFGFAFIWDRCIILVHLPSSPG